MTREKMQQIADLITTSSKPSGNAQQGAGQGAEQPTPETGVPGLPGMEPGEPTVPGAGGERTSQVSPPDFPPPTPGADQQPQQPRQSSNASSSIDTSRLPTADTYQPDIYNLNTAPPEVLATIDGMTDQVAQAIVEQRAQLPFTTRGDLLALPAVTEDVFGQIVEKVTVRSSALKITSIGSVEDGRVRVRLTVIVDLKESEPRIVSIAEG